MASYLRLRQICLVAAHLEPEILLVDEVLAVGDTAFQNKSLNKMGDVVKGGRTVFFVSHNIAAIKALKSKNPKLGVPEFKDLTGVSRKYAIPLLEYLDRQRVTRRVGDERMIL